MPSSLGGGGGEIVPPTSNLWLIRIPHASYFTMRFLFLYFSESPVRYAEDSHNSNSGDCRCSGLEKNDDRLEIKPPEIYDADLTALVQLKSFSRKSMRVC